MRKNILLFLTLVVAGTLCYAVYTVKYEVEGLEAQKAQLTKTLLEDRNAIRVSWAEWYYLNSPDRLQSLADKYLPLGKTKPEQIGSIDDIPMRQAATKAVASVAYDLLKPGVEKSLAKSVSVASGGDRKDRERKVGSVAKLGPNTLASLESRLITTRPGPGP
jgi:hypothetical protein